MVIQLKHDIRGYHAGNISKRYLRETEAADEFELSSNCLHPMKSESWITRSALSLSVALIQSWTISSYHSIIRCLTRQQMARENHMFIR